MREAAFARKSQYSGALKWLALALLLPGAAGAQDSAERHIAPAGEGLRRGAVPESVQILEETIERLTDAPLYRDNAVEVLLDGPETHEAMLEAIASARHEVHLETYIFADDEIGAMFAKALAANADGARHPGMFASVVVALLVLAGGPRLMAALRRRRARAGAA